MGLSDEQRKTQVLHLREQLLDAAVRYVTNGQETTRKDRLRSASELSGYSTQTIEVEIHK